MISHIFVNGDSYSAENKEHAVYSKFLAEKTNLPVINQSNFGSSNDRIFRTSLEHISSLDSSIKPFVIVGFSFITRDEVWVDNFENYKNKIKDYKGSKFITLDWLQASDMTADLKQLITDQNINKQCVHFYTKLYMFSQTLKSLHIPYFLFSAAKNEDFKNLNWDSLNNLTMFNHVKQDPNILDFKIFNIPLWASQQGIKTTHTGHLFSDGHKKFAEFLFEKIEDKL